MIILKVNDQNQFREVQVVKLDRLTIYEISDSELDKLEKGSPESISLNIAIALITLATSTLFSLLTLDFKYFYIYIVFIVFTVLGFVIGAVLIIIWWKNHSSLSDCIKSIRSRKPPDGEELSG